MRKKQKKKKKGIKKNPMLITKIKAFRFVIEYCIK